MQSILEIDEWNSIKNNPHRRVQLLVNIADYLSKATKERRDHPESENNEGSLHNEQKQNLEMVNNMYEVLVSDILVNKNPEQVLGSDSRMEQLSSRVLRTSKPILQIREPNLGDPSNSPYQEEVQKKEQDMENVEESSLPRGAKPRHKTLSKLGDNLTVKQELENERKRLRRKTDMSIQFADNMKNLDEFSLESLDLEDSPTQEYRTISNFLNMQVLNKGTNIPWHMRKLILFTKTILTSPRMLFIDQQALDLGYKNSWEILIEKIQNVFPESLMITFFRDISNLKFFDQVVIMDEGNIIEEGNVKELLKNKKSELVRRLQTEDQFYLDELLKGFKISHAENDGFDDDSFEEISSPEEVLNSRVNADGTIGITIVPPRTDSFKSFSDNEDPNENNQMPISEDRKLRKMSGVFENLSERVRKPGGDDEAVDYE